MESILNISESTISAIQNLVYIGSSVLFILGIKMLGKEATAVKGNYLSALAMFSAVAITCLNLDIDFKIIIAGVLLGGLIGSAIAIKVKMTAIPEMVALFNGFGGLATFLIAWSQFNAPENNMFQHALIMLTIYIGGITFSGSLVAYGKLSERLKLGKGSLITNVLISFFYLSLPALVYVIFEPTISVAISTAIPSVSSYFLFFLGLTLIAGLGFVTPIGGGDMPVVISLLNSLSGIAAAFAGLLLENNVLIVAGSLVGASGLILTVIMAKAMNRTIGNILFVGYASPTQSTGAVEQGEVKPINAADAYLILENASSVLIVPGYGMAVAQAQHVVREMGELLEENGTEVKYGIHPVAGRMPGHMNVLLAEAKIPYDIVYEMDEVNGDFENIDLSIVIGANDIVNPSALEDPNSPISGMPVIECWRGTHTVVLKRGMSTGYAGVENPLFFKGNTRMLFGDAKESLLKVL
jgi:NAD(P) transhydrogenase subunit beta